MTHVHVAVVKNISNAAENNLFYKGLRDFEKQKFRRNTNFDKMFKVCL